MNEVRKRRPPKIDISVAKLMRAAGCTLAEIGARFGTTYQSAHNILRYHQDPKYRTKIQTYQREYARKRKATA